MHRLYNVNESRKYVYIVGKFLPIVTPLISVLVIAHDRKKFLMNAINSVINQDISNNSYEIVVVKNFSDNEIDSFLNEKGIKNVITDKGPLVSKILIGLGHCQGEILAFLDDDDLFTPSKISRLKQVFQENKGINYYHNSVKFISIVGEEIKFGNFYKIEAPDFILDTHLDIKDLLHLVEIGAALNTSCIAVKKFPFEEYLRSIQVVETWVDYSFLMWGVDKGGVFIDSEITTLARIHQEGFFENTPPLAIDEHIRSVIDNNRRVVRSIETVKANLEHPAVKKYSTAELNKFRLMGSFNDGSIGINNKIQILFDFAKTRIRPRTMFHVLSDITFELLFLFSIFFPKIGWMLTRVKFEFIDKV